MSNATLLPVILSHQLDAVTKIVAELELADRCKVSMACGTGKTRVGVETALATESKTVVVYVPSLALMQQTLPYWIDATFKGNLNYLCVCSDNTVASRDSDDPSTTVEEMIAELNLSKSRVTSSPAIIMEFLNACEPSSVNVIFSTYQSSDTVRDGMPEDFEFDLGIFDEAHRTAGKEGMFSAPLSDSHTKIAKRVFMTATPKHYDYKRINKQDSGGASIYSMDDERVYGKTAYNLPIRKAIDLGLIAGYKVLVSVIDDQMLAKEWASKVEGTNSEMLAHSLAIKSAMNEYGIKKTVTFHSSVDDAHAFANNQAIKQELGADIFHVNGKMHSNQRKIIISEFALSPQSVISNAKCLTEGVDVPEIDMVAFMHPKKSKVDIIQAVGRALRLRRGGNKTTGYILLPLYVSDNEVGKGGMEKALIDSGFDLVFQVIQALREQDEVVNAAIRDAVINRTQGKKVELPFLSVCGQLLQLDHLRSLISTACVDTLGQSWDEWIGRYIYFKSTEGHCAPDVNYKTADGFRLGSWVCAQRSNYNAGSLSLERTRELEAIGISWDPIGDNMDKMISALELFHQKNGHCDVRKKDGQKLYSFTHTLRTSRNSAESSPLFKNDRIARIDRMGFSWSGPKEVRESAMIDRLLSYWAKHGKGEVSSKIDAELNGWVWGQRRSFKQGKMPQTQIDSLNAIGFVWSFQDKAWQMMFDAYASYITSNKAEPPLTYLINGHSLGEWRNTQSSSFKESTLSQERIDLLNAIGFKWDLLDFLWDSTYQALSEYKDIFGDCIVPADWPFNQHLARWVLTQKRSKNKGILSAEREAKLNLIGFCWDTSPYSTKQTKWRSIFKERKETMQKRLDAKLALFRESSDQEEVLL